MANTGYSVDELIGAAINNAKEAAKGTETLVALDMGPIGQLLEPTGSLSFEEAYDIFKEEVIAPSNNIKSLSNIFLFATVFSILSKGTFFSKIT